MAGGRREPAAPPSVIRQLSELAEERGWKAPEVGRRMKRTGQWWRDIVAGRQNMTVADASRLAGLLEARLEVRAASLRSWDSVQSLLRNATDPVAEHDYGVTGFAALSDEQRRGVLLALARAVIGHFETEDRKTKPQRRTNKRTG